MILQCRFWNPDALGDGSVLFLFSWKLDDFSEAPWHTFALLAELEAI